MVSSASKGVALAGCAKILHGISGEVDAWLVRRSACEVTIAMILIDT